ncbi:MAG: putative 3-(3-hydroxy-phenyl)propionate hydroxylase, FAD/NAD(P)-binding [Mycobacterium sp.]|nr:putative 3-(3-hydroxy-phenyl)propionate hydroxylase, FAD/NAD(P)-binding [Mycobacterium sp.]
MEIEADVAIVGAGPCGATLANLLGGYDVNTVIVDREPDIIDYPRAVAVDDESLRSFQAAGVIDQILPDLIQNAPIRYHDSKGRILAHVAPAGQMFGWPRRNLFYQPLMEQALRRGLDRFDHVQLLTCAEVTSVKQSARAVRLSGKQGAAGFEICARYVVGADGGRSFVRSAVGMDMTGSTAASKWLVVDVEQDTWDAPYSAVYCSPIRPAMTIPLPYGRRRFEFKLLDDEQEDAIVEDEAVSRLIEPYYRDSTMPVIARRRVYWHHSRTAASFQVGRVFLAGDAAHLQPPFFGQGMNSGIRDASNLAWKLAEVCKGRAGTSLLVSYDVERREHAEKMVAFATRMGAMYQPRSALTESVRDAVFRAVQRVPGARDYILQMRYKPLPRYVQGVVVRPDKADAGSPVGRMFAQPTLETPAGTRVKLDDATGSGFAVVAVDADPMQLLSTAHADFWRSLGATFVRIASSRPGQRATGRPDDQAGTAESLVLHDIYGSFRDLLLGRPAEQVFIIRPDRYLAAAGRLEDLDRLTAELRSLLGSPAQSPVDR